MGWTPLSDRLKSTVFSQVDCHRSISNGTSFTLLPTRHRRRAVNTFGARFRRTETEDREAVQRSLIGKRNQPQTRLTTRIEDTRTGRPEVGSFRRALEPGPGQ